MSTSAFAPDSNEGAATSSLTMGHTNKEGLDPNAVKQVLEERKRLDDKLRMQQKELEELRKLKEDQARSQQHERQARDDLQKQQQELLQRQQELIKKYPPPPEQAPLQQQQQAQQQHLHRQSYNHVVSPTPPQPPQHHQPLNQQYPPPPPQPQPQPNAHSNSQLLTMDDIQRELHPPVKVGNRNYLTLPFMLWDGIVMHKYPFNKTGGAPSLRTFRIKHGSPNESGVECVITGGGYNNFFCEKYNTQGVLKVAMAPLQLEWFDAKRHKEQTDITKTMCLEEMTAIKRGHQTPTFWSYAAARGVESLHIADNCFSIEGRGRSVDCGCDRPETREAFLQAIGSLLRRFHNPLDDQIDYDEDPEGAHIDNLPYNEEEDKPKLFAAVKQDNIELIKYHFDTKNCPIDIMEEFSGDTVLISACRMGRIDIVALALERGARNDPHPDFGQTALQAAVSSGHANCVRIILETAAPSRSDEVIVNHEDANKEAPIHVSSRCGNLPVLELLIEHGANLHLVDSQGRTCLHCSCLNGHRNCLGYILDAGGDLLLEERDRHGRTCLHLAVKGNKMDCVKLLLETAADVNAVTPDGLTSYKMAVKSSYHTLARLLLEYSKSYTSDACSMSESEQPCYTSSSDVETSSRKSSLPRPHKSITSPSVSSRKSKASSGRMMLAKASMDSARLTNQGDNVWNSHGSLNSMSSGISNVPTPNSQSTMMFKGLDTFEAGVGVVGGGGGGGYGSGYEHSQSASPRMIVRAERGQQEIVDYASDSGYVGRNNFSGYSSDTGHRQMQSTNYGASEGYSSDAGYRTTSVVAMPKPNRSTSQPIPMSVHDGYSSDAPPSTIHRDDSGRSVMSGITMMEESEDRITSPSSWDEDGTETFHINADLWNVYESEGYPYYLRMRDNHSQWDDPRIVGVEGEEDSSEGTTPVQSQHAQQPNSQQPNSQQPTPQSTTQPTSVHKSLTVQTPYTKPPHDPLTSPTTMPGVGATFINVHNPSSGANPPHAHQPLSSEPKPPISAEQVFASKAVYGDGFVEAKSELDDDFQEAKETSLAEEEKSNNPLAAMLKARVGGSSAGAKKNGHANPLEEMLRAKMGGRESKAESKVESKAEEAKVDETKATSKAVSIENMPTKEDLKKDEETKKYVKMASVGVPAESVAQKMQSDGVNPAKIKSFRAVFNIQNDVKEEGQSEEKSLPPLTKEELCEIPELSKYMKMSKMGIPPPAVSQKMVKDGVSPANISKFEIAFGLVSTPSGKEQAGGALPPGKRRTTVKMTKVFMNQISSDKLKNSLWGTGDGEDDGNELATEDIKALEEAFGQSNIAKSPTKSAGKSNPGTPSKPKEVSLVDGKRAYNVNIGLAQFKSTFSEDYDSLMEAIVSLDETKMKIENVANLKSLLPTPTELRQVGSFKGDLKSLGRCERFFVAASKRPGICEIAESFFIILSFQESYATSLERFEAVNAACEQILKSKSLGPLLKKVLAVGNLMNEANNKPKAAGITLESLVKICLTKGSDKKTTVMDHVVQMFIEKEGVEGQKILMIGDELNGLKEGGRVKSMKGLYGELEDLKSGLRKVEKCRDGAGNATPDFVSGAAKFFNKAAPLIAKLEASSASTKESTSALYRYFGEDEKRTECSFILSVLTQFVGLVRKSQDAYVRRKRRKMLEQEREKRRAAAAAAKDEAKGVGPPPAVTNGQFGSSRGGKSQAKSMPPPPRPPPTNPNHNFNTNLLEQAMTDRRRSIQGLSPGERAERKTGEDTKADGDDDEDEWLDAAS